jgi:hypothetical protein
MNFIDTDPMAVCVACEQLAAAQGVTHRALRRLMALNAMKGVVTLQLVPPQALPHDADVIDAQHADLQGGAAPQLLQVCEFRPDRDRPVFEATTEWVTRLWQVGDTCIDYDAMADRLRVRSADEQTLHEWSEVVNAADCAIPSLRSMRLYWNDDVWRQLA